MDNELERLRRRRNELERQMRQRGGIRVIEELDLQSVRRRLAPLLDAEQVLGAPIAHGGGAVPSTGTLVP